MYIIIFFFFQKLPSRKVYVGNLPDNCDKENLQKLFESVGKIAEFDVVKNFGFVVSILKLA